MDMHAGPSGDRDLIHPVPVRVLGTAGDGIGRKIEEVPGTEIALGIGIGMVPEAGIGTVAPATTQRARARPS